MDDDFYIKNAEMNHIDDLINLLKILFEIEEDFEFCPDKHRVALTNIIRSPEKLCLIIERNGTAIAMSTAQWVYSTATGAKSAWIEDVVVKPEFQNQGIGKQLLAELLKQCKHLGCNRVQLAYDLNNEKAINFYKKQHFKTTQLGILSQKI